MYVHWPHTTYAQKSFTNLTVSLQVLKANDAPAGEPFSVEPAAVAKRAYKNAALSLLCATGEDQFFKDALSRYEAADNMTDSTGAISAVIDHQCPEREEMLSAFFKKWENEELVVLKWLTMQAMSNVPGNLANVKALVNHPKFKITNPNSCYSLLLAMSRSAVNFHNEDGSGYEFLADMVLKVDAVNAQVAARIASAFTTCAQLDKGRQALIQNALRRIMEHKGLSENVQEIVSKSLKPVQAA
jgi:aminopeptidase N